MSARSRFDRKTELALLRDGRVPLWAIYEVVPDAPRVVPPGDVDELYRAGFTPEQIAASDWYDPRTMSVRAGPWLPQEDA